MATKKSGGSAKNLRDSQPKYLGTKLHDGEKANVGMIIVRQRGTRIVPGKNVKVGRDHTLYAVKGGVVKFTTVRKTRFNGQIAIKKMASVV
ncbi:MAG: 50S ribosomal protein L27 [Patescibacteria group bacterium]